MQTIRLCRQTVTVKKNPRLNDGDFVYENGAADEIRTRDILLGRQMLYQLSYHRRSDIP